MGEILSMSDIAEEIVSTNWSDLAQRPNFSQVTASQAGQGAVGIGAIGVSQAIPSIAGALKSDTSKSTMWAQNRGKKRKVESFIHRRIEPIEPSSNSSSTTMSKASNGDEIPVMPVPRAVAKIIPDFFNIRIPTHATRVITSTTSSLGGDTAGKNYIILNQMTGNITGGDERGRGVNTWIAMFEYYRITSVDVKFTVTAAHNGYSRDQVFAFGHHFSDTTSSTDWTTMRDFAEAKQGGYMLMATADDTSKIYTQQFTYSPEAWDFHVSEQGISERWTPVSAAPNDPHYLHYGVLNAFPSGDIGSPAVVSASQDCTCRVKIEIVQHIQFREAKASIRNTELTN
eukprot:GHVU01166257.1.p1 GENE.GHVU01166257.1~~GHVU01166257.1.p1  ORF type:complete len:382 (-),score=27.90 GHVU01166257.1:322-1347(-)